MRVAMGPVMSPRNYLKKNMEAAIVVALSTGLAIVSANHFEQSGPDHALLEQLKEGQHSRRMRQIDVVIGAEGAEPPSGHMPLYAQR